MTCPWHTYDISNQTPYIECHKLLYQAMLVLEEKFDYIVYGQAQESGISKVPF